MLGEREDLGVRANKYIMLKQRVITAIILASLIINAVIFLPTIMLASVLAVIICVAAWEWAACAGFNDNAHKVAYVSVILLCLVACLNFMDNQWIILIVYCGFMWWLIAIFLVIRYQTNKYVNLSSRLLKAMIGSVILVPSWLSLILIHANTSSASLMLFLFLLIWLADSAAYFSGRKFGRFVTYTCSGKSRETCFIGQQRIIGYVR